MKKRSIVIIIGAVLLLVLMIVKLKANKTAAEKRIYIRDSSAAVLVQDTTPVLHTFESKFSFLGVFEPIKQNTIGSDAQGKVVSFSLEEGDRIGKGQLIAKVDDELLQLQIENTEVNIEGQKNDEKRYDNLVKENAVSGVQVEKTKLGIRSAEIQKKQLQKQLRNTSIVAPFSGVITKKMIDIGSVIGAGSPLVEITDISSVKLTVSVPERDILKFRMNQEVKVTVDIYGSRHFSGRVTNISVQADKAHNFKVQIVVNNAKQEIMAGMYGSASLTNNQSHTALSVLRKALVGSTKNPQVYVIRNGRAKLIPFNAGTSDGEYIEVISGLSTTDRIVLKGQVNIQDNSFVKTN
jgi:RND family efflux transporter MFP subunit